jgi:hypothetical protein
MSEFIRRDNVVVPEERVMARTHFKTLRKVIMKQAI